MHVVLEEREKVLYQRIAVLVDVPRVGRPAGGDAAGQRRHAHGHVAAQVAARHASRGRAVAGQGDAGEGVAEDAPCALPAAVFETKRTLTCSPTAAAMRCNTEVECPRYSACSMRAMADWAELIRFASADWVRPCRFRRAYTCSAMTAASVSATTRSSQPGVSPKRDDEHRLSLIAMRNRLDARHFASFA